MLICVVLRVSDVFNAFWFLCFDVYSIVCFFDNASPQPNNSCCFYFSVSSSALFVSVWACGGGFRFMLVFAIVVPFFSFVIPLFVVSFPVLHLLPTTNVFVIVFVSSTVQC